VIVEALSRWSSRAGGAGGSRPGWVLSGDYLHDGNKMVLIKDVVTVIPTVLLSVFAVLGMAVLIGLSSWDLPIRLED
jgi:hypothetical protein